MKPRWEPGYPEKSYPDERLIGYVEEFDVYFDANDEADYPITVIAEERGSRGHNFDSFRVTGNTLEPADYQDLTITPYHMCLLYALAIEHGLIKGEDDEAKMET